jgi:hypothetical protein
MARTFLAILSVVLLLGAALAGRLPPEVTSTAARIDPPPAHDEVQQALLSELTQELPPAKVAVLALMQRTGALSNLYPAQLALLVDVVDASNVVLMTPVQMLAVDHALREGRFKDALDQIQHAAPLGVGGRTLDGDEKPAQQAYDDMD